MRSLTVCVEYEDYLAVTLPRNLSHLEEAWVVTSPACAARTHGAVGGLPGVHVLVTDAFYRGGAVFNKWLAVEEGLDAMGRRGWLCLLDADVLWPREVVVTTTTAYGEEVLTLSYGCRPCTRLVPGRLCSPLRRMMTEPPVPLTPEALPQEREWERFPIHPNVGEWAGYTQVFHAADPALGPPPWHQTDWRHAGGADSFFQMRWSPHWKVRAPFEVLHLGPAGVNWMGRATPMADGRPAPDDAGGRLAAMHDLFSTRRRTGSLASERLPPARPPGA